MQNTTEVEHHYHQGLESIQDDPQCCTCEILTLTPEISPWEERKSVRDLHQILTISPEVRLLERAHFRVMESSTLHIQPSLTNLKTSSATLCEYTEPKSSSVGSSSSIPNYVFLASESSLILCERLQEELHIPKHGETDNVKPSPKRSR